MEDVCGTDKGYNRHIYRRQEPCQPCKTAHAEYQRDWRIKTGRTTHMLVPVSREDAA